MQRKLILLVSENNDISRKYSYCLDENYLLNNSLYKIINPQLNDLLSEWGVLQKRILFLRDVLKILINNPKLYDNYNSKGQFYIQELLNASEKLKESQSNNYLKLKEIIERYKLL